MQTKELNINCITTSMQTNDQGDKHNENKIK